MLMFSCGKHAYYRYFQVGVYLLWFSGLQVWLPSKVAMANMPGVLVPTWFLSCMISYVSLVPGMLSVLQNSARHSKMALLLSAVAVFVSGRFIFPTIEGSYINVGKDHKPSQLQTWLLSWDPYAELSKIPCYDHQVEQGGMYCHWSSGNWSLEYLGMPFFYYPFFIFGLLLGNVLSTESLSTRRQWFWGHLSDSTFLLLVVVILWCKIYELESFGEVPQFAGWLAQHALGMLFLYACAHGKGIMSWILRHPVVVAFNPYIFNFYLFHMVWQTFWPVGWYQNSNALPYYCFCWIGAWLVTELYQIQLVLRVKNCCSQFYDTCAQCFEKEIQIQSSQSADMPEGSHQSEQTPLLTKATPIHAEQSKPVSMVSANVL